MSTDKKNRNEEPAVNVPLDLWALARDALDVARDAVKQSYGAERTQASIRRIRAFARKDERLIRRSKAPKLRLVKR